MEVDGVTGEYCDVCGKFVPGFVYLYCCNDSDCSCQGRPEDPCICSDECFYKIMEGD